MNRIKSRHERRKLRTRRKLLDAARHVIGLLGYDDTNVLDITEEADVSKGTFYLHFKDKEDLTRTLIMEGFDALRTRLDDVLEQGPSLSRMKDALLVVFNYAAENRDLFRIMLGRQASAELTMMALDYYSKVVEDIIARSVDEDHQHALPPELLAQFITGAGVRIGLWWIEDDRGLTPDEISDIMFRLLSEGLGKFMPVDTKD